MRGKGISIIVIAKKLGVSKSTVSLWCRDIVLTDKQNQKLEKNKGISVKTGQRMGAEANKNKKLNVVQLADTWSEKVVGKISKRELLLVATALYWSEGSKSEQSSGFRFINSDPGMILFMKKFLKEYMDIQDEDLICSIQINKVHEPRIGKVLSFWINLLHLQDKQFRKPYFITTKSQKVYENYDDYYGICKLMVRRSSGLKYKMLGLIKSLKTVHMSM